MAHVTEHQEAATAAADVSAFIQSYGVECEVLPAGDRVVVHLPLSEAQGLLMAARMRGQLTRPPAREPQWLEDSLAFAY